jgi:hypothetical protein
MDIYRIIPPMSGGRPLDNPTNIGNGRPVDICTMSKWLSNLGTFLISQCTLTLAAQRRRSFISAVLHGFSVSTSTGLFYFRFFFNENFHLNICSNVQLHMVRMVEMFEPKIIRSYHIANSIKTNRDAFELSVYDCNRDVVLTYLTVPFNGNRLHGVYLLNQLYPVQFDSSQILQ